MKIILREDIDKLGKAGDIKNIAPGYARNYLLPRNLVWLATDGNLRRWEEEKKRRELIANKELKSIQELAQKLEKISCTIEVKVGEGEKIFGAVTNADISDSLSSQGIDFDKKDILLEEPIHHVGAYMVKLQLKHNVVANLKVWVVAEKGTTGQG